MKRKRTGPGVMYKAVHLQDFCTTNLSGFSNKYHMFSDSHAPVKTGLFMQSVFVKEEKFSCHENFMFYHVYLLFVTPTSFLHRV